MVRLDDRVEVRMSFHRATEAGDVLGIFYDLFLDSDPEIGKRFENTDLDRQKALLKTSLDSAIFASSDDRYGRAELERIRVSHGPSELDIPPRLYALWRDSLIEAVARTDPEFDDPIEASWRAVLQRAVDHLASKD